MSPFIKLAVMTEVNKLANPNAHMLRIQNKREGESGHHFTLPRLPGRTVGTVAE